MNQLLVFESAQCCSTGVCGAEVDPVLGRSELASRVAVVPMHSESPVGPERLREMSRGGVGYLEKHHV